MRESGYIELGQGRLHYLKIGSGKRLLLAFHGYGNSASLFYPFKAYLENDFTIVSIDLPHHGKTEWEKTALFHKKDLKELVIKLMSMFHADKCALIGYSLGGRVCLTIAEMMPAHVDCVLLIASDGLSFNPLYYFVTKTFIGKKIFRSFLSQPKRYRKFVDWMLHRKWIDESRYKFAMYYLGSERDRQLLLHVWSDLSLIVPNGRKLRSVIKKYHLPVFVFMGSYDRVIPVKKAEDFKKGLNSVKLFILEKGHRLFDADTLPQMAECLIGTC